MIKYGVENLEVPEETVQTEEELHVDKKPPDEVVAANSDASSKELTAKAQ